MFVDIEQLGKDDDFDDNGTLQRVRAGQMGSREVCVSVNLNPELLSGLTKKQQNDRLKELEQDLLEVVENSIGIESIVIQIGPLEIIE